MGTRMLVIRRANLLVLALATLRLQFAVSQQWTNDISFAEGRGQLSYEIRQDMMMIRAEFSAPRVKIAVGVAPYINESMRILEGADLAIGMPGNTSASRYAVIKGQLVSIDLGGMQSTYESDGDMTILEIVRPLSAGPKHVSITGDVYLITMWPQSATSNRAFFHHINVEAGMTQHPSKRHVPAHRVELTDNLDLRYELIDNSIAVNLTTRGNRWIAIGFSKSEHPAMVMNPPAEAWIGIPSAAVDLQAGAYLLKSFSPHEILSSRIALPQHIKAQVHRTDEGTTLAFRRPLKLGQLEIVAGESISLLWAVGLSDDFTMGHARSGIHKLVIPTGKDAKSVNSSVGAPAIRPTEATDASIIDIGVSSIAGSLSGPSTSIGCSSSESCGRHGKCKSDSTCKCDIGYSGDTCGRCSIGYTRHNGAECILIQNSREMRLDDNLMMTTVVKEGIATITLELARRAWLSVAFSRDRVMPNSEAVVYRPGQQTSVEAYDITGRTLKSLILKNSTMTRNAVGTSTSSSTTLTFRKRLDEDNVRFPISMNEVSTMLFAYGQPDASDEVKLQMHKRTECGAFTVDWMNGSIEELNSISIKHRAHGWLMIIAWLVCIPVAIISARFYKHIGPMWFHVHRAAVAAATVFTLTSFAIIFDSISSRGLSHFEGMHQQLGLIVVVVTLFQPLNALFRHAKSGKLGVKARSRIIWEVVHKGIGRLSLIVAIVNIFLGVDLVNDTDGTKYAFYIASSLLITLSLIFFALKCVQSSSHDDEERSSYAWDANYEQETLDAEFEHSTSNTYSRQSDSRIPY